MSSSQRGLLAIAAFLGALLIPFLVSSLRGLTHVLTCTERVASPFTLVIPKTGPPHVVSSTRFERGESKRLCGGLEVDLLARGIAPGRFALTVEMRNHTESIWNGSVDLKLEGGRATSLPVSIGEVAPDEVASDTVEFSLPLGTHEMGGSLLIGP